MGAVIRIIIDLGFLSSRFSALVITAELIRSGNLVVIDEMLLDDKVRDHWFELLRPLGAFFVGVYCELDELERREHERGNHPGLARWSAQHVHIGVQYDMVIETTSKTPMSCAEEIVNEIQASREC